MLGRHQVNNAALAVAAVTLLQDVFPVSETSIRTGLHKANWKGRFEKISDKPTIIVDGAHNEAGIRVLLETLRTQYPNRNYHFVFSALRDKNYSNMIKLLDEAATEIMITEFRHEREASAEVLFEHSQHEKKRMEKEWRKAIEAVIEHSKEEDIIIVTGSLYFLAMAREYLLESDLFEV